MRMRTTLACSACLFMYSGMADNVNRTGEEPQQTVRVMPVGDSITAGGKSFVSYRFPLRDQLAEAGYRVEFVGSQKSASAAGPLAHEGYGGRNAEFLASVLGKSFRKHPADIVLIHAGHNHFIHERPVPGIVAATEKMIADIRKTNAKVVVLLAQVITSGKLPKYSYIPDLNVALAKLATRLHTPEQPVVIVDQAEGFDWRTDTIGDKVHPNSKGAAKMAGRWFTALEPFLEKSGAGGAGGAGGGRQ